MIMFQFVNKCNTETIKLTPQQVGARESTERYKYFTYILRNTNTSMEQFEYDHHYLHIHGNGQDESSGTEGYHISPWLDWHL